MPASLAPWFVHFLKAAQPVPTSIAAHAPVIAGLRWVLMLPQCETVIYTRFVCPFSRVVELVCGFGHESHWYNPCRCLPVLSVTPDETLFPTLYNQYPPFTNTATNNTNSK